MRNRSAMWLLLLVAPTAVLGLTELVGCTESEPDPIPLPAADAGTVPGRTALCAEAVIPTGFGLAWENLNHRVAAYEVSFDTTKAAPCTPPYGTTVLAHFIGGDFTTGQVASDTPVVRCGYAVVGAYEPEQPSSAPAVQVAFGQAELAIDPSQTATAQLPDLALGGGVQTQVLAIAGIGLFTDVPQDPDYPEDYDPALGYTSNGMAIAIDEGPPAEATVRFGLGLGDRKNMNEAIPLAHTKAVAHVMNVGVADGALTRATHALQHQYPAAEPFDAAPLPPIPSEKAELTITGQPGFEHAVLLLTAVDFDLFQSNPGHGYYLRELSILPRVVAYDAATGAMTVDVGAYASNSGFLTEGPMEVDATVSLALLQWNGGGAVVRLAHEESFVVADGAVALPLPMEPPQPAP